MKKPTQETATKSDHDVALSALGRYESFVNTKKNGKAPVRRCCRNRTAASLQIRQREVKSNNKSDPLGHSATETNNLDDLCTIFQTLLIVDNYSLTVTDAVTKILSPEPQHGRRVSAKDDTFGEVNSCKEELRSFGDAEEATVMVKIKG